MVVVFIYFETVIVLRTRLYINLISLLETSGLISYCR